MEVLDRMVVEMCVQGLATRDIEQALQDLGDGDAASLSRSRVSRLSETLRDEYQAFCQRDLSDLEVVYFFGGCGLRVAPAASGPQGRSAGHLGHSGRRQQGARTHEPGQSGAVLGLAGALPGPCASGFEDTPDRDHRWRSRPDQGG